jgi:hypothetical protein
MRVKKHSIQKINRLIIVAICLFSSFLQAMGHWEPSLFEEGSALHQCVQNHAMTELRFFWTTPHMASPLPEPPNPILIGGTPEIAATFKEALAGFLQSTRAYQDQFRMVLVLDALTHATNPWLDDLKAEHPHLHLRPLAKEHAHFRENYPEHVACIDPIFSGPPVLTSDIDRLLGLDSMLNEKQAQSAHVTYLDIDLFAAVYGSQEKQMKAVKTFFSLYDQGPGVHWARTSFTNDILSVSLVGENAQENYRNFVRQEAFPDIIKNFASIQQIHLQNMIGNWCDEEVQEAFFRNAEAFMKGLHETLSAWDNIFLIMNVSGRGLIKRLCIKERHFPYVVEAYAATWNACSSELKRKHFRGVGRHEVHRWLERLLFYQTQLHRMRSAVRWGTLRPSDSLYQRYQKFFKENNPFDSLCLKEAFKNRLENKSFQERFEAFLKKFSDQEGTDILMKLSKELKEIGVEQQETSLGTYVKKMFLT